MRQSTSGHSIEFNEFRMKQNLKSRQEAFFEMLQERIIIADGAMGTILYSRGIPFSASFDELNLSQPEIIQEIHHEYLDAGAQIIETNTFGGNRIRLEHHALEDKVYDINFAGAKLARDASKSNAWIAGSVGPLGKPLKPVGVITLDDAKSYFREQIEALVDGGVDFILLETFTDLREISQALLAANEFKGCLPKIAKPS